MPNPCGIDADGFIRTPSQAPFQPPFQAVLEESCHLLAAQLGARLDSVYVYGSIAECRATPGVSDLDLCVLLRQAPTPQELAALARVQQQLQANHPIVSKVDVDIGALPEVLAAEQQLRWGYWLKHHCRCLWGPDRTQQFTPFRPSRDIAQAVNGDFAPVLADYAARLARTTDTADRLRWQREASRKLLRATSVLRTADESSWPQTLGDHAALLCRQYPQQTDEMAYFLTQAQAPAPDAAHFTRRLMACVHWMESAMTQTSEPHNPIGDTQDAHAHRRS